MKLKSPAKVNLGLSILKKLPNNYHEVKTIYHQVSLYDFIELRLVEKDTIVVSCPGKKGLEGKNNLVFKAIALLKQKTNFKGGIDVKIEKNIPIGSGLGGGSSNAATVLKALNKLWQLDLSSQHLISLAKRLGADVAYHLLGGAKMEYQGGNRAGKFLSLPKLPFCYIVICFPGILIKSKDAYQSVSDNFLNKNNLEGLLQAIKNKNLKKISQELYNDFESWAFKKNPLLLQIKKKFMKFGALGSLLSGKGSSVFAIFLNNEKAKKALTVLKNNYQDTFLTTPL